MDCKSCGAQVQATALACPYCQTPISPAAVDAPQKTTSSEVPLQASNGDSGAKSNRVSAGLWGVLGFGSLGIHKFVLGYNTAGAIMLAVSVLTMGAGAIPMGVIGLIEGIIYLTKTDEEFNRIYVKGKKEWF